MASQAVEDIYPLSPLQAGLLFHALSGDRGLYFEQLRCTLEGELDVAAFERTWRWLVSRHAVLRTAFDWEDADEPLQVVLGRGAELPIVHHDWRALPEALRQERLAVLLAEDRERGFELDEPPLMRLALVRTADDVHLLVWSFHHLLLDGWSSPLLLEEAFTVYDAVRRCEEPRLPPVRPYRDYIAWLKAQDPGRARSFWQSLLAGFTRPVRLQIDRGQGAGRSGAGRRLKLAIDAKRTARLSAFARQHQLTLNTLVQGAWARLLGCHGESDDVVFGITVSGRPPQLRGVERMVGLFINTLPLRVRVRLDEPLLPWLRALRRQQVELQPFESTPLAEIRRWSEITQGEPLFDSLLVFENYPLGAGEQRSGLAIRGLESSEQTNYPLTVAAQPGERLEIELFYDGTRFEPAAMARLAGHLATLLETVAEDPERRLGQWSLLSASERRQMLSPWHPAPVPGVSWQAVPAALGGEPVRPPVYLLDRALEPVPAGLRGEVFLAVGALPAGDLHGPAETAEQWLPDPFSGEPGARMARTGDLGRRTPAGVLEPAGATGRRVWIGDRRVDLAAIEAALLDDPGVDDAAVLARPTPAGPRLAAYVVPSGPWQPERLRARLVEGPAAPEAFVPVARLPLLPDGRIDEAALEQLETIEAGLIQRWEETLAARPGIGEVAVVARPATVKRPPLHVSDLLPAEPGEGEPARPAVVSEERAERGPATAPPGPPAIRHGEPLRNPQPDAPKNLQESLRRAAQRAPGRGVLYLDADGGEVFQSYPELLAEAERILGGLRQLGLKPGDKVLFQLDLNQDFLPAFWGCVLGGFVPIPVAVSPTYHEVNNVVSKLHNAWKILGRPWILTDGAHREALQGLAGLLAASDWRVATLDSLRAGERDRGWQEVTGDDPAFFQLTSGSTGIPKCVTLTHGNILHHVQAAIQLNAHAEDDVSLNWMPMDHVGSLLCYHQRDVYLGCLQLHAKPDAVIERPLNWLDWLERYRVTQTWAPNFAFKLVNEAIAKAPDRTWDLSAVRFIMNGGEQVALEVTRTFLRLLAGHGLKPRVMHPTYGMAELSSACIYSHRFDLERGTGVHFLSNTSLSGRVRFLESGHPGAVPFIEVGVPLPGFAMRIVDAEDRVVEEDVIGRLQARGPNVTRGYYDNPRVNAESFTADGWFNTGDLGFIHDGCLALTGREKDVIILHGANYYNHDIETCVEQVEGVEPTFAAAASVRDPVTASEKLVIFFTPVSDSAEDRLASIEEIRRAVTRKIGIKVELVVPVEKTAFPKTTSGKIQRAQLVEAFEAGRFGDALREIDIASGNANTVPDWFFRRVWRRKRAPAPAGAIGAGLVFADPAGLGAALCGGLRRPDRPWVLVEPGTELARLERDRYQLVPGDRDQHRRLLSALAAEGIVIDHVVHLGTYGEPGEIADLKALEKAQERGLYDLLHLVQALAEARAEPPRRLSLLVVASHAQAVTASDPVSPDRAALLGLVKTGPQEMPWLSCRHLDLPAADGERNLSRIHAELAAFDRDREVAWRHGRRHVAGLERLDLLREPAAETPFQRGGLVLLTGGLGGIGQEIARYLLREQEARLLLVGRTPLSDDSGRGAELRKALADLGRIGEVAYEALDVADEASLRAAVEAAEARWRHRLQGVVHLAGELRECLLAEETREGMAAALRPKVAGTWALSRLLRDRPGSFLIGFSSINSVFGGATMGSYAAANAFLEGFFDALESRGEPLRGTCLTWSMWDEVGMSRGYRLKDLSRARGYEPISPRQGLFSLLAALRHDQRRLIVGLAGENRHIRRFAETERYALEELAGFFTRGGEGMGLDSPPAVTDRFGVRSRCDLQALAEMPRLATGEIDRARLQATVGGARAAAPRTPPRSELERQLAEIWQQVLGCGSPVSVDDNFFQLGGDSILSIQVIARAREIGVQLTTQDLFQHPTIAQLAAHAVPGRAPSVAQEPVEGEVPLTPIQHWFFEQPHPDPHHFNMALIFAVRERLDGGVLGRAVSHLLWHHDALRLRFAPREAGWRQWHAAVEKDPPVIRVDLSRLTGAALRQAIESVAGQMQRSLHLSTGPLLRVAWLDAGNDRAGRLLIILHHLVVDGISWRILLEDLQRLYEDLSRGRTERLPAKTTSFQRWAELLQELARSEALTAELGYWLAQERHGVAALPRDRPEVAGETNDDFAARTVTLRLDSGETRALLQDVHRAYRTRIDDVLLTALVRAFCRLTGQRSLRVELEGHGREDLFEGVDVSRTVGWFTTLFPALLTLPEAASDGEALKAVKEQLRRIPRRGLGFGLLRYLRDDPETAPLRQVRPAEVSFNYLGQTDQVLSASGLFARADEEIGPTSHPRGERRHLIDVYGQTTGGGLEIHWTYSEKVHHRSTVERLAQDFRAALRAIIDHCRPGDAFGYTPSDFPLARLDQAQLDRLVGGRRGVEDLYPLVPMQQGLLFHALYSPDSWEYFDQLSCTLAGDFDLPAFEEAWRRVLARHSILRTAFVWNGLEEPLQRVEEQVELPLERLDWQGLPVEEQEERLRRFLAADRRRGFDLGQAPLLRLTLIRLAEDVWRLVWSSHHLLLDGWSRPLLLREFFALYEAGCRGEDAGLAPAGRFRDYVAWLKRQDQAKAEAFWRRQLRGFPRPTRLGIDRPAEPGSSSEDDYAGAHGELDAALTGSLQALARQHRLTLGTLVQGAWGLLLARYSGERDVLFGTTVSGRPSDLPGIETMVGLFINSLPLRLDVEPGEPLLPWLRRLQDLLAAMRQHESTPLNMVQGWSEVPRGEALFESLLVFENYPMGEAIGTPIGGLEIRDIELKDRASYPLTLVVIPGERLAFEVLYDGGRFDGAAIRRLMGHLEILLRGMVENPDRRLGELPLMVEAEKRAVVAAAAQRRKRLPAHVQNLLKKAAEKKEERGTPV